MSKGANAFTGVIGLAMFFGALFSVDLRLGFGALGALLVCINLNRLERTKTFDKRARK